MFRHLLTRCFLLVCPLLPTVLTLGTVLSLGTAPSYGKSDDRPNFVLILCDDLGYADVGFNGATDIRTPELDQLAKSGTRFSSAYVTHPFCGPSRMGLMSGRYAHQFGSPFNLPNSGQGIEDYNRQGIDVNETLISSVLQDAGYHTGAIGKWHMGIDPPYHPNARGFADYYGFLGGGHMYFPDKFRAVYERQSRSGKTQINEYVMPLEHNGKPVDEQEYITDGLSREAVRFISEASTKDQPFFLYLAYNAPHSPLEAKEVDMAKFSEIKDVKRRTYAAMVYAVDRGVGRIVQSIRSAGVEENTLIVFLSDNGGKLDLGANNGPLRGEKGSTYEGGYRVPMFFNWPGTVPADNSYHYPVSALDFYPTFANLAGATIPAGKQLDGVDIWSALLAGQNARPDRMIYALRHQSGFSDIGARRDQWKIVRNGKQAWKLFDLDQDIGENNDLSGMYPDRVRSLVSEVESWSETHTKPKWFNSKAAEKKWHVDGMPHYDKTFQID